MLPTGISWSSNIGDAWGSHRTNVGGWTGLAYAAIEPCYAGGRAETRRAERMKRRRDVIMALAVRERELNGQTRKGV